MIQAENCKMYTQIRILPMDKEEEFHDYSSVEEIQKNFFKKDLLNRKIVRNNILVVPYQYKKMGLISDKGSTLVLFQYNNLIVACANLVDYEKYEIAVNEYFGSLYFDSIKIFQPFTNDSINQIFNLDITFNRTKYKLNPKYQNNLLKLIEKYKI